MGGRTKPKNGNYAPKRQCALLRLRSARAQRATPARSAAYGDAKRALFRFGPGFVKRIGPQVLVPMDKRRAFSSSPFWRRSPTAPQ